MDCQVPVEEFRQCICSIMHVSLDNHMVLYSSVGSHRGGHPPKCCVLGISCIVSLCCVQSICTVDVVVRLNMDSGNKEYLFQRAQTLINVYGV